MSAYRFFPSFQPETVRPHRAWLGGARLVHYESPPAPAPTELASVERGLCTTRRPPLPPPPSLPRWSAACALPGAPRSRPHRACLGGARLVHYQAPPAPAPTELASVGRGLCTTRRPPLPPPPSLPRWGAACALTHRIAPRSYSP